MMEPHPSLAGLGRSLPDGTFFFDSAAAGGGSGKGPAERRPASPPLVLVHGLGDEADSFRHLFPLQSPARRVLALDLPGFGRSPAGGKVNVAACIKAVIALLEAECPSGAVVAGSSLGAAIAELASFARPELFQALVLMDGGLPAAGARLAPATLLPGLGERAYRGLRGRPAAAFDSLRPYYADLDALGGDDRDFLSRRVVERVESASQMRAYFSLLRSFVLTVAREGRACARRLGEATTPLLVLWGERDAVLPPAGAGLLAKAAPRARVSLIAGAGHLPHQERPEATAAAIAAFA